MTVLLDFESRSRADLRKVGGRRYWEHPSSEALVCVWYDLNAGVAGAWYPGQPWPHVGRTLAAHNAMGFDRFASERYGFAASAWIDTSQLARKAGLPGALDALGTRWLGVPKDDEGSRFTRALSSVRRPPSRHPLCIPADEWRALSPDEKRERGLLPELTPATRARVLEYCASDVAILVDAWPMLAPWIAVDADAERVDATVNDRGVAFDVELAKRLAYEDACRMGEAIDALATRMGLTWAEVEAAARSPQQFCAITGAPDAQAVTVEGLDHPLARVREAIASISAGKLEAGLRRVHADGRLRDTLLYYGAHTGRWSGRGMQLQNLPRPAKHLEGVDVDALAGEVLDGRECTADEIALLVRATIMAAPGCELVANDYSGIEARATAWAAGDEAALGVFRSGRDPYKVAAAAIYGVEYDAVDKEQRTAGKMAELACGYGGGPAAIARIARAGRIDVSALDLDAIVAAWRELHAPVRALWYACEKAFRSAARGRNAWAGPFEFVASTEPRGSVACFLPSGRPVVYNDVELGDDGDLAYVGTRGREHIYGGKLVENAVQALCRDLMADALATAERRGLRPVLTVHDEIVCEVPAGAGDEALAELGEIMVAAPTWSAGLPINTAGWKGKRYRK